MKSFNIGDLKIKVPIVQGGMGIGISLSKLASAVANMGGIGIISTVGIGITGTNKNVNHRIGNIEGLRDEIRKAKILTPGILGVNIMSVLTDFSDMVKTSLEEGIDIIFSGAGLPLDLPKYLGEGIKTKLVPIISSSRAATIIWKKWSQNYSYIPDAFVVEGPEAGGHLGFKAEELEDEGKSLPTLVKEVRMVSDEIFRIHKKRVPVIAAGGIYSGTDIYEIIEQGASAVQMGTRFVATEECDASQGFKDAFVNASESDIGIIKSPVGMPGRAIQNNFLKEATAGLRRPSRCSYNCLRSCNPKTTLYCIYNALAAAYNGKFGDGFAFTGTNAGRIKKITTVKEIFTELKNEFNKISGREKK
jgi:nitronate monooxygenase